MTEQTVDRPPIITDIYRLTPAAYLRVCAAGLFLRMCLWYSLPLAVCAVAALFDVRWLLVALIMLFLTVPFALFHIYFTRLLTTDAQKSLAPQCVTIIPGKEITVTYHSISEENTPPQPDINAWNDIRTIRIHGKQMVIAIRNRHHPLIIPIRSFPSTADPHALALPFIQ